MMQKSLRGGLKSRRNGGSFVRTGKSPPICRPTEVTRADGVEFPRHDATKQQLRVLDQEIMLYGRRVIVRCLKDREFPDSYVCEQLKLQKRQGGIVINDALYLDGSAEFNMTVAILRGMLSGEMPAIDDVPKTETRKVALRTVADFDATAYVAELARWFGKPGDGSDNFALFRKLQAAFRVRYEQWIRRTG
jgi:hypothetical protein